MSDFKNLLKKRIELQNKKKNLRLELDSIEKKLWFYNNEIYDKCMENGGHKFIKERDYQLCGEVTLTCEYCGYIK
tara:strand:+ start:147 stop:371 length:225 start_codon:yes stop_codon:yes gene_type:complete